MWRYLKRAESIRVRLLATTESTAAGEKAYMTSVFRKDKGVPIGEAVQKEFIEVRDKYNLDYKFPFEK